MISGAQSATSSSIESASRWGLQAGAEAQTVQAAAVRASRTTEAELKIVTNEGDTVTLSLESETDLSLATYSSLVRGKGGSGRVKVNLATLSSRSGMGIHVEGDLSEEERADISHLLRNVGRALRSFFSGHIRAAVRRLASLGNLGSSLASFDLKASQTESVSTAWWRKLIS
jgi:hypothetical protein